jgi:hypothetical protein
MAAAAVPRSHSQTLSPAQGGDTSSRKAPFHVLVWVVGCLLCTMWWAGGVVGRCVVGWVLVLVLGGICRRSMCGGGVGCCRSIVVRCVCVTLLLCMCCAMRARPAKQPPRDLHVCRELVYTCFNYPVGPPCPQGVRVGRVVYTLEMPRRCLGWGGVGRPAAASGRTAGERAS